MNIFIYLPWFNSVYLGYKKRPWGRRQMSHEETFGYLKIQIVSSPVGAHPCTPENSQIQAIPWYARIPAH